MNLSKLRKVVFFPTFIVIIAILIISSVSSEKYFEVVNAINFWIKSNLSWLFVLTTTLLVVISLIVYFTPIGNITIGGKGAKPLLKKWDWFAITLCTTVAAGLMMWATAEPLAHFMSPPEFLGIEPGTHDAMLFSMSAVYANWSVTPYAIYSTCGLMFALAYYNMKQPYSFRGCIAPILGEKTTNKCATLLDTVILLVMGLGMAASLGTGILSVSGGVSNITDIPIETFLITTVGIAIAVTFIVSSATGLMKGIRILSSFNVWLYMAIIGLLFIFGPTAKILDITIESTGYYLDNFFTRSLITGTLDSSNWNHYWTASYYGNWMTWAPIVGLFLGRISYGYSVRQFVIMNLFVPSVFTIIWFGIFGGSAILMQSGGTDLFSVYSNQGAESVLYALMELMPMSAITIPLLVLAAFISFVTAADSTTNAMAGLAWRGVDPVNPETPTFLKIALGVLVVGVSIIMVNGEGVRGIKILTAIGSVPALILIILSSASLVKTMHNPSTVDVTANEALSVADIEEEKTERTVKNLKHEG